jgi:hypothetical protein
MLTIKLEGLEALQRQFGEMPRKVEIAAQRALLKTAQAVKDAEQAEMRRVFDRPTRWTLGAIKVKATSKWALHVGILDPDGYYKRAANYLGTQTTGGDRRLKAFEKSLQARDIMPRGWFAVPGECAKLDAYGNMGPGQIRQILSWFDAAENWAGSTQNMGDAGRDKRRKGTKKSYGWEYFVVTPGARRTFMRKSGKTGTHAMQPGIYMRIMTGFGTAIRPILIFVKGARYQARFNFDRVAQDIAQATFSAEMDKALALELKR